MFLYDEHISRLARSLEAVSIDKPKQWKNLERIILDLLQRNKFQIRQSIYKLLEGRIKHVHTIPDETTAPTLFIESSELSADLLSLT